MKDAIDSVPADRPLAQDSYANRKLIRPSLNRNDHNHAPQAMGERRDRPERSERSERPDRGDRGDRNHSGPGKKSAPPEQTNAENFYYQKQMQTKTPMVVVL